MRGRLTGSAALALALFPLPATVAGASTASARRHGPASPSGTAHVTALPAPSTSVALRLTSTAPSGITSSLDLRYTATVTSDCRLGDRSTRPCPVPSGTLTWRLDGGDTSPGNVTVSTRRIATCTSAVSSRHPSSGCAVHWPSLGDQWLTATYHARPGRSLVASATIEVGLAAPVDLAAGMRFAPYANVGPGAIGDCALAAAADLIEATYDTAPDPRAIVASYDAAEDAENGGRDVGLSAAQLFAYWRQRGIAHTRLTAVAAVATSAVASHLDGGEVLYATAELPAGFPAGSTGAAAHAWLVVGSSRYGPMVVSWGEELQLSWADFDAWTTGVWAIATTRPP